MTFRVSTFTGVPTPNLAIAVGWAVDSIAETGTSATIANGSEGAISLTRRSDGSIAIDMASLFPPPWADRVVRLIQALEGEPA